MRHTTRTGVAQVLAAARAAGRGALLMTLLIGPGVLPVWAQGGTNLTIEDAVTRGLAQAPRLAEARARELASSATATARGALARPSVTALSGFVRTNHVEEFGIPQANGDTRIIFPDIPNNYRARAELNVPIYSSGRVAASLASARADERAAVADRLTTAADIELDIITTYWTLATNRERVMVLERAQERADTVVADVGARVDSGLLPPNERLSAQAQRARQRVVLIQAQNDAAVAEAQLARLVGLPPGEPISLATPVSRPSPDVADLAPRSSQQLAVLATTARPERAALVARQAASRAMGEAAIAALRPQVAALAAIEPARPNARFVPRVDRWHTSWDLGVNVSWSLWDGGRARAERAAAEALAAAMGARVDEFDASVGVEVRQRQLDVEAMRAAIAAATEAVDAATEARRVVGERFGAGVATSTEVLDSDVALLEAELERTRLTATLRVNEARLVRAVGGR